MSRGPLDDLMTLGLRGAQPREELDTSRYLMCPRCRGDWWGDACDHGGHILLVPLCLMERGRFIRRGNA